jgi:hypothetical protein
MSGATIASLVFFSFSFVAAAAVERLFGIAEGAGLNTWAFMMVPALLAMLYALLVYQRAERKIRRVGESISRGILVMLLTWVSIAVAITWARYQPREFGYYLGTSLTASGIIGGGPMLLCALAAGTLSGVLIIRKPKPRIL